MEVHADDRNEERAFGIAAAAENAGDDVGNSNKRLSEGLYPEHRCTNADDSGVADKDAHKLRSEDVQQNRRYDHYENAFDDAFVGITQGEFFVL